MEAPLERVAEEEHGHRRPVIGPGLPVLRDAAAELRPRHDHDVVGTAVSLDVPPESTQSLARIGQKLG